MTDQLNYETLDLPEEYATVAVRPGEPFRLFPYGKLVKNGKERVITPELAQKFKLPHFKPPIKLGSHEETTPAGGYIIGLETREDGLWAIPEMTEKGQKSLTEGDYRYHSPEVIWDGGFEDPQTGKEISAPLIVGDAFLHMPHLGEQAALFTVSTISTKESESMDENVQVPKSLFDKFLAAIHIGKADEPKTEPVQEPEIPEEYKAAVQERDELKAEKAKLEADASLKVKVEKYTTELQATKVTDGAEKLASMPDETAEWVLTQFKALSEQIKESDLLSEKGSSGAGTTDMKPGDVLDIEIKQYAEEHKINYISAFEALRREKPELFNAWGKE